MLTIDSAIRDDIAAVVERHGAERTSLIPILQDIKKEHREITDEAMQVVADLLDIHPVEVYSVATFYAFLHGAPEGRFVVRLCGTLACDFAGKTAVAEALRTALGIEFGATTDDGVFTLEWASCVGMCDQGPAMLVNDKVLTRVTPAKVAEIVAEYRAKGADETRQDIVTARNELTYAGIEPDAGLKAALALSRGDIVDTVSAAALKGRGGAGFPTGMKWNFCAAEKSAHKYIICNADEGEPGTFKDRVILRDFPDLVFEGMTIGGRAIGADMGIVYLRAEYAYLRAHLNEVIQRRRQAGLLGKNVGGIAGFDFDIVLARGAGAYVCGEETALIESLEGFRGEPRNRPPFPAVAGFLNHPTTVNNVETLASVACIFAKGTDWFKSFGTDKSTGYKLFSISGDCEKPGVYEFPWGITVADLLKEVGGAGAKAVQIGGASGVCVPAADFARRLAFEDIPTGGSVMVIGAQRDLLDVAENFLEFFVEESCGQCNPCRLGNPKLLEGVELLKQGTCSAEHLADLKALGATMQVAAKCGLGQTSPSAFLSIVGAFADDVTTRPQRA
jgi:NADH:ubiquinone oxidoreductase, NADH-binding (51 kD) subunit